MQDTRDRQTTKQGVSPSTVEMAICNVKNSNAIGPDGISPVMMKHVSPHGRRFLANLYTHVINMAVIPSIWKTGRIIPLHKPGKPKDKGKGYRPISLLLPPAKILEACILPLLTESVKLASHQHGYRQGRSTCTALQHIKDRITSGLNKRSPWIGPWWSHWTSQGPSRPSTTTSCLRTFGGST